MAELSHPAFEDASNTPWAVIALWSAVVASLSMFAAPWMCYLPLTVAFVAAAIAVGTSLRALAVPGASVEARHMAVASFVIGIAIVALTLIVGGLIGAYIAVLVAMVVAGG